MEFEGIESLFDGKKSLSNLLQTMLYSMILHHKHKRNVEPSLYYVRNMQSGDYNPRVIDKQKGEVDYISYAEEFEQLLREKLAEIFNPDIPFTQCEAVSSDGGPCKYCDFKTICKR